MSQDNIFREVDEELRSDRMRAFWRRFAPYIIGAAVAVVVVVAVNEGLAWYNSSNSAKSSDELYAAFDLIDGGDLPAAQTALDQVIANGSGSYPTLAQFREAGVLVKENKIPEAVAAYDALSTNLSNVRLRELALVLAGNLLVDSGSLADVQARVETIATDGNPLRNAAREALGLAQFKAGDYAAAQASFEAVINDPYTQSGTRNRMGYYIAQLVSEGVITDTSADVATPAEAAANAIDDIVNSDNPAGTAPAATPEAAPAAPVSDDVVPAAPATAPEAAPAAPATAPEPAAAAPAASAPPATAPASAAPAATTSTETTPAQ